MSELSNAQPTAQAALELSILMVVYNMNREAPRTIVSLSPEYQRVDPRRYEIVVVDNGSTTPLTDDELAAGGPSVRYIRLEPPASPSPAGALNVAARAARAPLLGIIVDGARMASPGLVGNALSAAKPHHDPVVTTLAWHLGPETRKKSVLNGFDQAAEDELLRSIGWPADGYRLFEISTLAPSSSRGYLVPLPECSAMFLPAASFAAFGGFDERFQQPAGGYVALDFFRRSIERPGVTPIMLLGEGTFHQLHGPVGTHDREQFRAVYQSIRGQPFAPPAYRPILFGDPGTASLSLLARSAEIAESLSAPHPTVDS